MNAKSRDVELGGELGELRFDLFEALLGVAHQVHLVDGKHQVGDLQQRGEEGVPAALLLHPLRASTRITARSAVEAPVTMLRVYWMCPGVSAMMNVRRGVAKYR